MSISADRRPRNWLDRLWSSIADRGRAYAGVPADSVAPGERAILLARDLLSGRGEASGAARARALLDVLHGLDAPARMAFCRHLADGYLPDPVQLRAAAEAYLADPTPARASALADAAEPPRQELLRRMNQAPRGTAALVALRQEILGVLRAEPALAPLDTDLRHLFASWFNRGFLELRRIDWNTPASVLEKLIQYEAVHEIQGWDDLRRRLAPDRRCFAFFHPALPGDPLIFVEVALVQGLAGAIAPLLAPDLGAPEVADTAIFYSISNCQDGLRGISFGNFLIKQVVEELKQELPQLRVFSTLSPMPGFRRWLERRDDVPADPAHAEAATIALAAQYLTNPGPNAADPVARFHLGNGARLERINWMGNPAPRGVQESYGVMVNYLYDPDTIEENHEVYARGGVVVRSAAVAALLPPSAS
ncbi:MAG: malonyl-CoA decarboxylase [Acetobacteraceae bacterium]|nr:malonyl-CoA decarboxylase [Acetobacteraceae bacterium]